MPSAALRVDLREVAGAAVLAPTGVLDAASYGQLRTLLVKAATNEPRAVIVDLDGLAVPDRAALALFSSVSDQLADWPGVPLLLAVERPGQRALLDGYRLARFVPIHPSVLAAVAAVDAPAVRRIARRKLPNSLASAAIARRFVLDVCRQWPVAMRVQDAMIIANELVENTLLHTYCAPSLRLELRRGLLTVAVYDDDPAPARLIEPEAETLCHRGLVLVSELSRVWGCSPTPSGGKVVWAVLKA
ncbi:STAS domain-containing protein [Actinophytocola sp.]|uniref:STAS domain-containing protein n=1 Tax=Actinophytocola sp. TaxID=1872138 RepID=UPI002ED91A22